MTKHEALQDYIEETRRLLYAERKRILHEIEMRNEALAEVMQELKQLPSEDQVKELPYQELAAATERFGIPVPDVLLVEDDHDNGNVEVVL